MAAMVNNSEKLNVLEEIYHASTPKSVPKKTVSERLRPILRYLAEPKRVEVMLSGTVLFLASGALVFGIVQFKYNTIKNFLPKAADKIILPAPAALPADLLGLKNKDTDGDGLSDYDELYVYHTSPYLWSTNGDGMSDKQKIQKGIDPNCLPLMGKNCFAPSMLAVTASSTKSDVSDVYFGGQSQVTLLRQALKRSGMTDDELAQLNDQQLYDAYRQALQENSQTVQGTAPSITPDQLSSLTPDQIRQMLRQGGVSEDLLQHISDQDLMSMVQELASSTPKVNQPSQSATQ